MRLIASISIVALAATALACDDEPSSLLPTAPLAVASDAVSAYVAVSNANPGVGSEVTVFVRARRGTAVGPIGSFTIRLAFDSTRLQFKDAARSELGMVMANGANAGLLVAAGASASGFTNDELLAATFLVKAVNALAGLQLTVSELNSVNFTNQTSSVQVARGLYRDTSK